MSGVDQERVRKMAGIGWWTDAVERSGHVDSLHTVVSLAGGSDCVSNSQQRQCFCTERFVDTLSTESNLNIRDHGRNSNFCRCQVKLRSRHHVRDIARPRIRFP